MISDLEGQETLLKGMLSDPWNPDNAIILRVNPETFDRSIRPMFLAMRAVYQDQGAMDIGAIASTALWEDFGPKVRSVLTSWVAEVCDTPFGVRRLAINLLKRQNDTKARQILTEGLKGPSEALESAIHESLAILEAPTELDDDATLEAELNSLRAGIPLVPKHLQSNRVILGIPKLDRMLASLPGDTGVIAAKPSAGKSSLALQSAIITARQGIPTLYLGLEMPRAQICARAFAWETGVDSFDLIRGHIPDVAHTPEWIKNLHVYDKIPKGSFQECRELLLKARRKGIETVFVDYWTLLSPPDTKAKSNTAYLLGEMSRGFKGIAKETLQHIVLVSQFNREVKDGERPSLENLRETGQLEQDASWVLMLWNERTDYGPFDDRGVWIELQKNRSGGRGGKAYAKFRPSTGQICEAAEPEEPQQTTKQKFGR